jgi:hypothetical protein
MKAIRIVALGVLTLGLCATSQTARAEPGITVGLDMEPTGNVCTGPAASGETCTLGDIDKCIAVPNTEGYEFDIDLFITGLYMGFSQFVEQIHFPGTQLTVQALDSVSPDVALAAQATNSIVHDDGSGTTPTATSPVCVACAEFGTTENGTWTEGTLARITMKVNAGATSDVYGLTLTGPPLAVYEDQFTAYYSSIEILDANHADNYGQIALGVDCPGVPVGGIAELPDVSGSSAPNYIALAALAAAALLALSAGGWYARRRWLS